MFLTDLIFSLLKSMKKQQRLKRMKSESSGGTTVPSSKSLLRLDGPVFNEKSFNTTPNMHSIACVLELCLFLNALSNITLSRIE